MSGGSRHNAGKPRATLIDPAFIWGMARVLMAGEDEYGKANWMRGLTYENLLDSMSRHMESIKAGEDVDSKSGEQHAYHIACNAMFIAWNIANNRSDLDDRRFGENFDVSLLSGAESPGGLHAEQIEEERLHLPEVQQPEEESTAPGQEDGGDPIVRLQHRIAAWAEKVMPNRTADDALRKLMLDELPELLHGGLQDPHEYADVLILVLDIAYLAGIDAVDAAHRKMAINEGRGWCIKGNGLIQHVEE